MDPSIHTMKQAKYDENIFVKVNQFPAIFRRHIPTPFLSTPEFFISFLFRH